MAGWTFGTAGGMISIANGRDLIEVRLISLNEQAAPLQLRLPFEGELRLPSDH
jgi:hypothetical protein